MQAPPPVPGFVWTWGQEAVSVELRVERVRQKLRFLVNGAEVPVFDAAGLLVACNKPAAEYALSKEHRTLLTAALYASKEPEFQGLLNMKNKKEDRSRTRKKSRTEGHVN